MWKYQIYYINWNKKVTIRISIAIYTHRMNSNKRKRIFLFKHLTRKTFFSLFSYFILIALKRMFVHFIMSLILWVLLLKIHKKYLYWPFSFPSFCVKNSCVWSSLQINILEFIPMSDSCGCRHKNPFGRNFALH